jgi:methylated-DNA-[protein]-cysteine S-methyltransferase
MLKMRDTKGRVTGAFAQPCDVARMVFAASINREKLMQLFYHQFDSVIGPLLAVVDEQALRILHFVGGKHEPVLDAMWQTQPNHPLILRLQEQLELYFARRLQQFDLPLNPQGTPFQQQAWHALGQIPYGQTRSYAEQAATMSMPKAVRAVGAANGRNPIGILIPCHRVVGSDGSLTGYAGGIERKDFLLRLEGSRLC